VVFSPQTGNHPISFAIRPVSDARGNLVIEATDEFFYFAADHPLLAGAEIEIIDSITLQPVGPKVTTGANGVARFDDLPEGHYTVRASAHKHNSFEGDFLVQAGKDNTKRIFLTRNLVTYTWTVREVEVQDRYRITVETQFETNVPAPVVTITPAEIDLGDLPEIGMTKQVNLTLENHGLIDAEAAKFVFSRHDWYEDQTPCE